MILLRDLLTKTCMRTSCNRHRKIKYLLKTHPSLKFQSLDSRPFIHLNFPLHSAPCCFSSSSSLTTFYISSFSLITSPCPLTLTRLSRVLDGIAMFGMMTSTGFADPQPLAESDRNRRENLPLSLTPCRGRAKSVTALKADDTLLSNNHRRLKSGYPPDRHKI